MKVRPYITKQIPYIEEIVEKTIDEKVLKALLYELGFRSGRKRISDLKIHIENKLKEGLLPSSESTAIKKTISLDNISVDSGPVSVNNASTKLNETNVMTSNEKQNPDIAYPSGFLADMFENMRSKLLDISGGRSRLLNLKQETRGFVRVVDELPDQLTDLLLNEKSLTMVSVPDPTQEELIDEGYIKWDEEQDKWIKLKDHPSARDWAKKRGIINNYELPVDSSHADDGRHQDSDVQTLLYEASLSTNLKKLSTNAKTSIEETGNNILFLSLGFLEWTDQAQGRTRLAPLFMIPVSINKVDMRNITVYQIRYTGEDIIPNLTLREKLNQDFGLTLPAITDPNDEDHLLTPEQYFKSIEALLVLTSNNAGFRDWKVRRYGTLATLSLGRLLMYGDLDPMRWPEGEGNLLNHDFIRKFFSTGESGERKGSLEGGSISSGDNSYVLDEVEELHDNYPMVEDADSSQMSALIDILRGNNMVIEGPPGTGKSQTITNLISAAISQGKSVLFVAEKQAALDVVKRRMDKAGLGDFCLDLHSDKAQKRTVLDSFNERIHFQNRHRFSESEYQVQVDRYERARKQLQDYCSMVNKPWHDTRLTIHDILCAATRYEKEVAPLEYREIEPEGISGTNYSLTKLDEQIEQLDVYYRYLDVVSKQLPEAGSWESHPWFGVQDIRVASIDERSLLVQLNDWTDSLEQLHSHFLSIVQEYEFACEDSLTITDIEEWGVSFSQIKQLTGKEYLAGFKNIHSGDIAELNLAIKAYRSVAYEILLANETFNQSLLSDVSLFSKLKDAFSSFSSLGMSASVSFEELVKGLVVLDSVILLATKVDNKRNEFLQHLPAVYKSDMTARLMLNQTGLKEIAGFVEHAMALPSEYLSYRDDIYDEESLPLILSEFKKEQQTLLDERAYLSSIFKLDKALTAEEIKVHAEVLSKTGMFSFFNKSWRSAKKAVAHFCHNEKVNAKGIAVELERLAKWFEVTAKLKDEEQYRKSFGLEFKGLDTDTLRIDTLMRWYQNVRKDYGIGFGQRTVMANTLFTLKKDIFRGIQQLHSAGINSDISTLLDNLQSLSKLFNGNTFLNDKQVELCGTNNPLRELRLDVTYNLEAVQKYLIDPNLSQSKLTIALGRLDEITRGLNQLNGYSVNERFFNGSLLLEVGSKGYVPEDLAVVQDTVNYLSDLYESVEHFELIDLITLNDSASVIDRLRNHSRELSIEVEKFQQNEDGFFRLVTTNRASWFKHSGQDMQDAYKRNQLAADNIVWLDSWSKYLYARDRMQAGGHGRLKDYLANGIYSLDHAKKVMNFAIYKCLANEIYLKEPELARRSGHEQAVIQEQFRKYDEGLKVLQRKRVADLALKRDIEQGSSGARVASYTGDNLLRHEINKKSRHISIRNLVSRAGGAMQGYKPCFMMSPMAVAKYLPPGKITFDIVVMDEASQVKPEFALSCFARGKQAVVVGDPKQLPPTSFFERSTSNEDEGEDVGVINEAESILEAIGQHYPKRMLQWHYRSRHESLINFSNRHFYNSDLVIFPSPWAASDEFGVKFTYVENGVFANNVNNEEAKEIVDNIRSHFIENPNESLGIVAMNSKQRDLIESTMEMVLSSDSVFQEAYRRNLQSEDPLFIKNLENVQGDERDVIYISFTYGPQVRGGHSVAQRFGPINGEHGWRRLNVLYTRAKNRVHVFSSMKASHIIVSEDSKRGVKALKDYLAYAETGLLIEQSNLSKGEPDSDFEVAVMKQLNNAGFACVPQVGVSGFKIDIGVLDPGMPGRYLMGVECDGATYHSSRSTRDRDKVRQGVLEDLKWNIKRIWSTDWFKNPDAELKTIIAELRELATPVSDSITPLDIEDVDAKVETETAFDPEAPTTANLQERLTHFNADYICKQFPDTAMENRLLRPEMIEVLVTERPLDRDAFFEVIPAYLRTHTSTDEASEYLGDVLEIIAVYEEVYA